MGNIVQLYLLENIVQSRIPCTEPVDNSFLIEQYVANLTSIAVILLCT